MTEVAAKRIESGADDGDRSIERLLADCMLLCISALTLFGYFLISPKTLADGDTGWHIAAGRWMIAHRQIPASDVLSYLRSGPPQS